MSDDVALRARAAAAAKLALHGEPQGRPTDEQKAQASAPMRFIQGLRDPIDAGAQLLSHAAPDSLNAALDYIPNKMRQSDSPLLQTIGERFLADPRPTNQTLSGLVTGKTGGMDQRLADEEKQYQASRQATGNTGFDAARLTGNLVSPVNVAIGANAPAAITTGGKLASAAVQGARYGALSAPVTEGDFAKEKLKQTALGAAAGPAAELIGAGAARLVQPQTRQAVQKIMSEGITPTPGQILGGRWQVLEDKLTSVPLLGDAIASARGKGLNELNTAAYKRVLEPINGTVPKTVGRDAVADVHQQVSNAYDNLLPKVQFKADPQFAQDLQTLQTMAENLPPEQATRFQKILRDKVIGKMTPQGSMDGQTLKGIESDLGELSSGLGKDHSFDNRQLASAIGEIQAAVRSNLERANPQYASELKAANTAWANFKRVQNAAGKVGADEGKFTPGQLQSAVRSLDRSKDKRAFSEGTALMQDLSDPAKNVLASKYPDSGSAGRAIAGIGTGAAIGGGVSAIPEDYKSLGIPGVAGGILALLPFLPGGRQAMAALLTKRPDAAGPIAQKIRELAPAATPALIQSLKPAATQGNY